LGHPRPSTEENAHPHRDCTGKIVVVHNGIVENYLSLKKKLIEEGHKFSTETDTEVIAHLIEKYLFKTGNAHHPTLEEAVRRTVKELSEYSLWLLSRRRTQQDRRRAQRSSSGGCLGNDETLWRPTFPPSFITRAIFSSSPMATSPWSPRGCAITDFDEPRSSARCSM